MTKFYIVDLFVRNTENQSCIFISESGWRQKCAAVDLSKLNRVKVQVPCDRSPRLKSLNAALWTCPLLPVCSCKVVPAPEPSQWADKEQTAPPTLFLFPSRLLIFCLPARVWVHISLLNLLHYCQNFKHCQKSVLVALIFPLVTDHSFSKASASQREHR